MGSPLMTSSLASVVAFAAIPLPDRSKTAKSPSPASRSPFRMILPLNTSSVVVWSSGSGSSADPLARRFTSHRLMGVKVFAGLAPGVFPGDDAHPARILRQRHIWNLPLEQRLVAGLGALV